MCELQFSESAATFFENATAKLQRRLERCFNQIQENPRSHSNIKLLKGEYADYYRYRLGDYRVVYSIDDDTIRVLIVTIDHRSKVYEY